MAPSYAAVALLATIASAVYAAPPEIVSDGSSLVLNAEGGVFQSGEDGNLLRVANEQDVSDLTLLIGDGIEQATKDAKKDLEAQVKDMLAAHTALAAKQTATEAKLTKALASLEEYRLAATQASDANGKVATCQKSLVDAVHSGKQDFTGCPDPTDATQGGCGEYPAVDNGVVQGHGTRKGAVRVLECNDGYRRTASSLSGILTCAGNNVWSDGKKSRCEATTTTTTTATTSTSTTTVYKPWVLLYRQKDCQMPTDGRLGKDVGASSNDDCFSRLTMIKNFKVGGKFTFQLKYPDDKHKNEIVWSQTSDPNLAPKEVVSNYQEVSVDSRAPWDHIHAGAKFSGLARSTSSSICYLDGERAGYWFAIGHETKSFPGLPYVAAKRVRCDNRWDTCWVELWVKNKPQ